MGVERSRPPGRERPVTVGRPGGRSGPAAGQAAPARLEVPARTATPASAPNRSGSAAWPGRLRGPGRRAPGRRSRRFASRVAISASPNPCAAPPTSFTNGDRSRGRRTHGRRSHRRRALAMPPSCDRTSTATSWNPCVLEGVAPPRSRSRMLPAAPDEARAVLRQAPNPRRPLGDHGADLRREHLAVARLTDADPEHHVAENQAPVRPQHTADFGERQARPVVVEMVEAVVGDHEVHAGVHEREAPRRRHDALDVLAPGAGCFGREVVAHRAGDVERQT